MGIFVDTTRFEWDNGQRYNFMKRIPFYHDYSGFRVQTSSTTKEDHMRPLSARVFENGISA